MIIGIDGNEANIERRVGIGEYAFELLKQFENFQFLPQNSRTNFQFIIYLKNKQINELPKERPGWTYRIVGQKKLWTQIGLPLDLYIHRPRPDVFFTPTHYAPRFSPIPYAISVMDLSFLYFPQLFKWSDLYQLKSWTNYSVKKAKKVFTISNVTKNDIIREYQVEPQKIVITYPGIKQELNMDRKETSRFKSKYGISNQYILFVGTLQPRKNVAKLIEAFSIFLKQIKNNTIDLVIVGKKGWMYKEILKAPEKYQVFDNVKFIDYVSDRDLPSFYKNAEFFILPSLYEGFGLPILEAMKMGCPVITSNVSSLPEAGGDAALYVDPEKVLDIAEKMRILFKNKKLKEELVKKGYLQIKKFSWEKTARETLNVLMELAKA